MPRGLSCRPSLGLHAPQRTESAAHRATFVRARARARARVCVCVVLARGVIVNRHAGAGDELHPGEQGACDRFRGPFRALDQPRRPGAGPHSQRGAAPEPDEVRPRGRAVASCRARQEVDRRRYIASPGCVWETTYDFVAWTHSPSFALAHAQKTPRGTFTHAPALDIHGVHLMTEDQATAPDGPPRQGVLVTNCIPVSKAHAADFEDRSANRTHLVDQAPGFIRNEVLRPARTVRLCVGSRAAPHTERRSAATACPAADGSAILQAPKQFDHATGKWRDAAGGGVYQISTLWETMQDFIDWTASPGGDRDAS